MAEPQAPNDENLLITRCQEGDHSAFDVLVANHAARVYNLAYRMLGSQEEAEDAAQEAFLRAFSSLRKFRGGCAFSTWLHRITVNICLDELKRRKSRPRPMSSLRTASNENDPDLMETLAAADTSQDPQEIIAARTTQQEVQAALANLPPEQRAIVTLCDIEGYSYEEAAAALKLGMGTVKSRLHRARQHLKVLLAPRWELNPAGVSQINSEKNVL